MFTRTLEPSNTNSFFLFGPRGAGKTTFLHQKYSSENTLFIDLLDHKIFDELTLDPSRFDSMILHKDNQKKSVIIDEIQRMPRLLDSVQRFIQKDRRQFILTGSSARRLKQQGTNLLAGRAWVYHLYPFSTFELKNDFDLKKVLERGSLPDAFLAPDDLSAREYLNAYVATYLEKEIQAEQWVRHLQPFRKFLAIAAQMNGKIINKSKIANEVGISDITVANYFEILEDTLLGMTLPAYHKSIRKAQRQTPKFYFIDPGIKRALEKTLSVELLPQTSAWGEAFEHWVILEIIKNASYHRFDWSFSYLRTKDDQEIDLIIERPGKTTLLIEIKSKSRITEKDVKTLETLGSDISPNGEKWLLSNDPLRRTIKQTEAIYWQDALNILFANKLHS